jgi:shikimate dehydrogenase
MKRYVVIGNPIEHSLSPAIHALFAKQTGKNITYEKLLCPVDQLQNCIKQLIISGAQGCNITVPFKHEAFALAKRVSQHAALAQASNVLRFDPDDWYADNTDGLGLVRDIEHNAQFILAGKRVLLMGAGGAAAGALGPLLSARPARLVVANRNLEKAQALVARHRDLSLATNTHLTTTSLEHCTATFDVVINATSSSLQGQTPDVSPKVLSKNGLALDMMYGPKALPFLNWAKVHGTQARDGLGMLVEQAAESFYIWHGIRPKTQEVMAQLQIQS